MFPLGHIQVPYAMGWNLRSVIKDTNSATDTVDLV